MLSNLIKLGRLGPGCAAMARYWDYTLHQLNRAPAASSPQFGQIRVNQPLVTEKSSHVTLMVPDVLPAFVLVIHFVMRKLPHRRTLYIFHALSVQIRMKSPRSSYQEASASKVNRFWHATCSTFQLLASLSLLIRQIQGPNEKVCYFGCQWRLMLRGVRYPLVSAEYPYSSNRNLHRLIPRYLQKFSTSTNPLDQHTANRVYILCISSKGRHHRTCKVCPTSLYSSKPILGELFLVWQLCDFAKLLSHQSSSPLVYMSIVEPRTSK